MWWTSGGPWVAASGSDILPVTADVTRPATRFGALSRRARARQAWIVAAAVGAFVATAFALYVFQVAPGTLGLDLPAYTEAAARLLATGSPYSEEIHRGPLDHLVANIPVNYVYPPPVAQLFVPLSVIPLPLLSVLWTVSQWVILGALLVVLDRRVTGTADTGRAVLILLGTAALHPVQVGLYIGGVSGWIAILVCLVLLGSPALRAGSTAAAAWIKVIPGSFAVGALVDRETRRATFVAGVAMFAVSFALSPRAWLDFVAVLPSLVAMPAAVTHANYAPAYLVAGAAGPAAASVVWIMLPAAFLAMTVVNAIASRRLAWVAAAAGMYLTATATSWQQYFVVLVPIAVAAWPVMSARFRWLVVLLWAWYSFAWFASAAAWHQWIGTGLWLAFLLWIGLAPVWARARAAARG